jgi:hypothetical protein
VAPRRLLPLGLGVTALLVLAGIASNGRPLSGASRGTGPTVTFFDYFFTTIVLIGLAMTAVVAYALVTMEPTRFTPQRRRWHLVMTLAWLFACVILGWLFLHAGFVQRFTKSLQRVGQQGQTSSPPGRPAPSGKGVRAARVRWEEVGIVLVLLAGTAVALLAGRHARRAPRLLPRSSQEAVSLALDESLDDLRNEPDLRRAIVAAYARMERALAAAGIAREPAEAPFEYLERALRSLDTNAGAVHRLTDLFEWAKFSQHEPEPAMRDEAIDALVAVRDELRRPAEAAVA